MKVKLLVLILLLPLFSFGQDTVVPPAKLFQEEAIVEINIKTNLRSLIKDVGDDREDHDATLSYKDEEGKKVSLEVKLKTRGNFRRSRSTCNFPPLRVNFKKNGVEGTLFENQDKLKLVTHCQTNKEAYEQFLLQEYLVYKVYNLLTPQSFQARLVRITYTDKKDDYEPFTRYAFFIEEGRQMATRNHGKYDKKAMVHPEMTDKAQTDLMSVFQYMIANTDWSIPYQHNICLIDLNFDEPIPVPYDFDWSGLIAPPYARPDPSLEISSVRERLFRGFCRTEAEFQATFEVFRQHKTGIIALFQNQVGLSEKSKERSISFIEKFFENIDNPKMVKREFLDRCRED